MLQEVYDRSGYDYFIDYRVDPLPPLSEADVAWLDARLGTQGERCAEINPLPPDMSLFDAIAGKWPGSETDEQIASALERLS
jgi:hypothetical protein